MNITPKLRASKARFWQRFDANPTLGTPEALSGPQIDRLAGYQQLYTALSGDEELYNWFFDKEYAHTVIKSGVETAVETLVTMCVSPVDKVENPAMARLKAAETLIKYGLNDLNPRNSKVYDSRIEKMSREELEAFVKEGTRGLKLAKKSS